MTTPLVITNERERIAALEAENERLKTKLANANRLFSWALKNQGNPRLWQCLQDGMDGTQE